MSNSSLSKLDKVWWPHPAKVDLPMRYPFGHRQVKPLRDTKWAIPPEQRETLIHDDYYNVPERIQEEVDKIYNEFKKNED